MQHAPTSFCQQFPYYDIFTPSGKGIMFMNYMDYVPDSCYNLFTYSQKLRILEALQVGQKY